MKFTFPHIPHGRILFSRRIRYAVATVLVCGVIGMLGYYIYKNFYLTITQAEEIVLLRQEVAPDIVDTKHFEQAEAHLLNRAALPFPLLNQDPFVIRATVPVVTESQPEPPVATSTKASAEVIQ